MTDRASAEGLPGYWTLREMRYHPDLKDKSADYIEGWDAATRTLLALRDTGPRPDGADRVCVHGTDASEECPECGFDFTSWRDAARRLHESGDDEPYATDSGIDVCPVFELPTPHRYGIACTACGQKGQITVSVTPRTETSDD